jgi:hypothetical protein
MALGSHRGAFGLPGNRVKPVKRQKTVKIDGVGKVKIEVRRVSHLGEPSGFRFKLNGEEPKRDFINYHSVQAGAYKEKGDIPTLEELFAWVFTEIVSRLEGK